jgi:hypothetical protein
MAVEYNFSDAQYVSFGNVINGLTNKTVMAWIKPVSFTASFFHGIGGKRSTADPGFSMGVDPGSAFLWYHESFSVSAGNWRTSTSITTGVSHLVGYTHDGTTAAPAAYHDGVSVAVTQVTAPSGTLSADSTKPLVIGNYSHAAGGTKSINGPVLSFLVYSRILTAAEWADAYASRLAIPTYRGLVFAPSLIGGAGLTVFDGSTLVAGNTIADTISGAVGVPTGSPVGRGDTYLCFGN